MPTVEQRITTVLDQDRTATTGRGLVQLMLVSLGLMVAFLGLRMGLGDGWSAESFHGPAVPLLPVVAGGMAIAYLGWTMWTRGRLRAALVAAGVAVVVLAVGLTVVARLPEHVFPGPPNWVLVLAGAIVLTVGVLMGAGPARSLDGNGAGHAQSWSTRTRDLLRGRYGFPRVLAVSAVEGLRREREEAGVVWAAGELQGHPEVLAAQLASREPDAARRSIRSNRLAWLAAAVAWMGALSVPQLVRDGATPPGMLPLVVGLLVLAWSVWRFLPRHRDADASALMDRRRARARRIALVVETDASSPAGS